MRDEDDAAAARLDLRQNAEQPLDLRRRKRRGRLVENDDARAGEQDPRKLDQLLHADREIAEPRARIDIEPEVLQLFGRRARHVAPGDDPETIDRLRPEKHIFCDAELRRDAEFLMDHADPRRQRVARRAEMHVLAVDLHLAFVGAMDAGDNFHQRALARAVLAGEAMNLAGKQRKVDASKRLDAAKRLRDAGQFQQRWRHRRASQGRSDQELFFHPEHAVGIVLGDDGPVGDDVLRDVRSGLGAVDHRRDARDNGAAMDAA